MHESSTDFALNPNLHRMIQNFKLQGFRSIKIILSLTSAESIELVTFENMIDDKGCAVSMNTCSDIHITLPE